ncbi:hypothetical protein LAZ67_1002268 [Cordylochernes scorpioides]|uniref:Histone-lysine N-methyltransferase SETMAR n=1 Tax=Cordylochernes scorpioides TaxID=51811 RepID=A0ABY6JVZ0_9ARAC|nr:hypothetical protein LAZ67_1002268 [Cordylochernes scorpioides]
MYHLGDCQASFEVLEHPAYSPDLAPSDYFLFGLLKKELKGKRFDSDEDVQKVVQDFFHTLPKSAYKEGIYKLPERWRRCIESQGDYFELDEPECEYILKTLSWVVAIDRVVCIDRCMYHTADNRVV